MRQKGFVPILIILAVIIVLGVVGYFGYKNVFTQKGSTPSPVSETNSGDLIGIWQASGSMASGWADRYHFYSDGKFHFYPNQMIKTNLVEETGTWKLENNLLILNNKKYTLKILGTQEDDFYPSIMIGNSQYWKFSVDPTSYGDEKFPDK